MVSWLSFKRFIISAIIALLTMSAASASKEILNIEKIVKPGSSPYSKIMPGNRPEFVSDVSRSNILKLDRERPGALPFARKGLPLDVFQVDTLTVLGLRVQFKEETPNDPLTTGNGLFDMRDTLQFKEEEGHYFDTSPHNKNYFAAHLQAMSHYWWEMSGHTLVIQYEIWPPGVDSVYQLDKTNGYYHEEYGDDPRNVLGGYFKDAIELADSISPDLDFAQADGRIKPIIIFHPGSDRQNDYNGDSPRDFYTGFLFLFEPVVVDSGANQVSEGIIMPETTTQDRPSIEWPVGVLNGVMAHEFGHVLGTRDFYSTCNFGTRIGDFSLMDNNFSTTGADFGANIPFVYGVLPASLDIWTKAYLGFINPITVTDSTGIGIVAAGMNKEGTKCVKVPIDNYEYFVIGNHQKEIDYDVSNPNIDYPNVILLDKVTSVVMGPGYAITDADTLIKVVTGEYDRLLDTPPENTKGGILVFHIDEVVAYSDFFGAGIGNWDLNTLQCDTSRWFIRVVEADEEVTFGNIYHAGTGSTEDLYPFGSRNMLNPDTRPFSSGSNSGANTGISISNITAPDSIMYIDVKVDRHLPGWPKNSVPGNVASHPVPVDVNVDGKMEIFQANQYILTGFNSDGSGIINNDYSLQLLGFDNKPISIPLKVFALLPDSISYVGTPSVGDLDGDGTKEVVIGANDGNLYVYKASDGDADGLADLASGFPVELGAAAAVTPILGNFDSTVTLEICMANINGKVTVHDHSGNLISEADSIPGVPRGLAVGGDPNAIAFTCNPADSLSDSSYVGMIRLGEHQVSWKRGYFDTYLYEPVIGDIEGDEVEQVVIASKSGLIAVYTVQGGELANGWPADAQDSLGAGPVIADIDRNGFAEIIVPGTNQIHCYSFTGSPVENFPAELNRTHPNGLVNSPVIVTDVDADGFPDILVGGPQRDVFGFNHNGGSLAIFPLAVGLPVNSSPFAGDIDGDGDIDLGARGDDGFINAWDMAQTFVDSLNIWPSYGGGPEHKFYHSKNLLGPVPPSGQLLSSVYAWPNPSHTSASNIHFKLGKAGDAQINIKIFDVAGNLMGDYNIIKAGPADNEYIWDSSEFASGVYLARVEARFGGESDYKFTKIAVVR
ncbi:MAG: hypothetical protein CO189_12060 [candidate division Zixibacteria bacterium CG_4_9_14_3_um_filter_46_8]|nr:MAG: hypothetical protein CO189_12060 [candidate division Zixibacteria bacterium CG_4_9_14_3_um_filter_46_8]